MKEFLTPHSIASTIRMLRSKYQGAFLILEGDRDARLFRRLTHPTCMVQLAYNRRAVIEVVSILDGSDFEGHLGIIDGDFAELFNETLETDNIIVTHLNDLELVIFESDVFDRFSNEYGSASKIVTFQQQKNLSLRDAVLQAASVVGTLRYLSRVHGWNLRFDQMTYRFAERRDIEIDVRAQIGHLRGRTQDTTMPSDENVCQQIEVVAQQFPDRIKRVCGHDLCEVIAHGMHQVFGRAHIALGRGGIAIGEVFRASYSYDEFRKSNLFQKIRVWETAHQPYKILA